MFLGGVVYMATKSILKNINIRSQNAAHRLVNALECAERFKGEPVEMSRPVIEVKKGNMKDFFSKVKV